MDVITKIVLYQSMLCLAAIATAVRVVGHLLRPVSNGCEHWTVKTCVFLTYTYIRVAADRGEWCTRWQCLEQTFRSSSSCMEHANA